LHYFTWPDLGKFLSCAATHKIVVVEVDYFKVPATRELLNQIQDCDQVFVYSIEFTHNIVESICKKYDYSNFTFVANGFTNFEMQQATLCQTWPWFYCTATPYLEQLSHELDRLLPFADKSLTFDVLLGRPKPHRKFVSDWIKNSNQRLEYFQPPFFDAKSGDLNLHNQDYWEDGIQIDSIDAYACLYHDISMRITQVLPVKIYNQTAYSLVCETECSNDCTFFTEKTVKPIIACRLFVMIAGQYYLRNLRKIGFQTFDSVIDESYDQEPDPETRWRMAMEQCDWLCKQDQDVILRKIMPTVLHNFNLLAGLDTSVLDNQVQLFLIQNGYYKK
jgi:hypothetical protein